MKIFQFAICFLSRRYNLIVWSVVDVTWILFALCIHFLNAWLQRKTEKFHIKLMEIEKNGTWNKNQWTIYICDMESIFSAGAEWEDVFSVRSFFSFFFCVGRFFLFSIMANHKATNFQCFGKKRQERHRYSSSVFHLNSITQIRWKKKFVFLI